MKRANNLGEKNLSCWEKHMLGLEVVLPKSVNEIPFEIWINKQIDKGHDLFLDRKRK